MSAVLPGNNSHRIVNNSVNMLLNGIYGWKDGLTDICVRMGCVRVLVYLCVCELKYLDQEHSYRYSQPRYSTRNEISTFCVLRLELVIMAITVFWQQKSK